jgi:7,8-dihydropterin-6-yl-methyl-4-(beta-D-ribofuranosyl)aminobenzene 5'-phosphate synthase
MELCITTLSENTAKYGFLAEWGLSLLVEYDGTRILLDTGYSYSAVHNAQLLGVDMAATDKIVLSHGHMDHTGGLRDVLKRKGRVEIIAHPDIWATKYARPPSEKERYAGIPFLQEELQSLGAVFKQTREAVPITDRIMTTGEIPMVTSYETIDANIFVKEKEMVLPDRMADDLALVIDADFGLVVILGCAHRGMINTLRHAQNLTGKESIYAVIGGAHLFRASEEQVGQTIADLKKMRVQKLGLCHCTGFAASARLAHEFGDAFFTNNAGNRFTLHA